MLYVHNGEGFKAVGFPQEQLQFLCPTPQNLTTLSPEPWNHLTHFWHYNIYVVYT